MAKPYEIPKWAGKPPVGLHLDVLKEGKLVQKLMVDEKKCYLFGRNAELNDFCIDHASCSRIHSAMVYHKHLNRAFLVDLGSTHGTYIGSIRLESQKPTQLPLDSQFHFGASTRMYVLRERPQASSQKSMMSTGSAADDKIGDNSDGALLLPETEIELDNLTEFNTAHNRRISMLGIVDDEIGPMNRKRKTKGVSFNEDEEIINPEDIDPSVGRFRNLIQTSVIPKKRKKTDGNLVLGDVQHPHHELSRRVQPLHYSDGLYGDLPSSTASTLHPFAAKMPNPAPDVDTNSSALMTNADLPLLPVPQLPLPSSLVGAQRIPSSSLEPANPLEPRKKKYAKEAWPGKKPAPSLLM